MAGPLVDPSNEKTPRSSSPGPRKLGSVLKVIPSVPGLGGEPVPSIQESFCIQLAENGPAACGLNRGLPPGVAVSCNVTDCTTHCPAPKDASNAATAGAASKRSRV